MKEVKRIKELVELLNTYRNEYYNLSKPSISDLEYDKLFDELKELEVKTNFIMSNSPTQTVGYEVKSKLEKVEHNHLMLSLDKTKSVDKLIEFADDKDCLLMHKLDGLTVLLAYNNGQLIQAETRGNGTIGEVITHNARVFKNIPLTIPYKGKFEIEGEAIITYQDFEEINKKLPEDKKYKNPRNLVSGSVRQLDNKIAKDRNIRFIAWKVPTNLHETMLGRLNIAKEYGFDTVPFWTYANNSSDKENINQIIGDLKSKSDELGYPIDGLVMSYNDIDYGLSLGQTGHHPRHSLAFKFYEDEEITRIINVDFTMGKTGTLTPVAIFEPVELNGTTVEKASLHNISILKGLKIGIGDEVAVYKSNEIIPQIRENLTQSGNLTIPTVCPICGAETKIVRDINTEVLICTNNNCKGKLLGRLSHFVSRDAMNVDGLSEATIEKFIDIGLLNCALDIYCLNEYKDQISRLDGFGDKSISKLLKAIENSKQTTLARFIYALSIPLIGKTASKTIAEYFDNDYDKFINECNNGFDFTVLKDFGENMNTSFNNYLLNNYEFIKLLSSQLIFTKQNKNNNTDGIFSGMSLYCTGSFACGKKKELQEIVESNGGIFANGYSKSLGYLVVGSLKGSSKEEKAIKDNIRVLSEDEFLSMIG